MKLFDKEKWGVVDLHALCVLYHNDKTLTQDTYQIIDTYDFTVFHLR
ncbi:hypothetical protein [Runella sp.]